LSASLDSLVEKEVVEYAGKYANELNEGSEYRVSVERKKRVESEFETCEQSSKINSRGMEQANKHVIMAALTYNLKKYLRFNRKQTRPIAMEMEWPKAKALKMDKIDVLKRFLNSLYLLNLKTSL